MSNLTSFLVRHSSIAAALAGTFLAAVAAFSLVPVFGVEARLEILFGWMAAFLNGAVHAWISTRAAGAQPGTFLRVGILTNALRVAIVLGSFVAVCSISRLRLEPFALSFVAGTVVFLVCNAIALASAGAGSKNT